MKMKVLSIDDCIPDSYYHANFQNRVLVMAPETLKPEYRSERNQLWLGGAGFGCNPALSGTMVSAVCLSDGECAPWRRDNFLGVIRPEKLPDWARLALGSLQADAPGADERHEFMGYSFLQNGAYGRGVPLRDVHEIKRYVERQQGYQHRVMICDRMDCCVLDIVDGKLIFPTQEQADSFLAEPGQSGGIQMI